MQLTPCHNLNLGIKMIPSRAHYNASAGKNSLHA